MMKRNCLICNKEFRVKPSRVRSGRGKYCSRQHADIGRNAQVTYSCAVCEGAFQIPRSESMRQVRNWCSNKCRYSVPENNPNWKGGITKWYVKIRNSERYQAWRRSVLRRDNFTCQVCNRRGGVLEVDHIKPFSLYPELRLELNNGQALCSGCHLTKTQRDKVTITKRGQLANVLSSRYGGALL